MSYFIARRRSESEKKYAATILTTMAAGRHVAPLSGTPEERRRSRTVVMLETVPTYSPMYPDSVALLSG